MKKKSKLPIIIVTVGVIAVAVTLYLSLSRQQQIFDAQAQQIKGMDIETEEIDPKLYTTGNYMAAEGDMKTYISEYQQKLSEFGSMMNDETLASMLGIENIESDGPKFKDSKAYIQEKRGLMESLYEELLYMGTEESVLAAVDEESPGDVILKLYEGAMLDTIGLEIYKTEEELKPQLDEMLSRLDDIKAILSFLSSNEENWHVEEGVIRFTEDSYLEEYQSLTAAISG